MRHYNFVPTASWNTAHYNMDGATVNMKPSHVLGPLSVPFHARDISFTITGPSDISLYADINRRIAFFQLLVFKNSQVFRNFNNIIYSCHGNLGY
jgi:hypothetical protein